MRTAARLQEMRAGIILKRSEYRDNIDQHFPCRMSGYFIQNPVGGHIVGDFGIFENQTFYLFDFFFTQVHQISLIAVGVK